MTRPVETDDMQGLLARAYGHLPHARYLLCAVVDGAKARAWLGRLVDGISTAGKRDDGCAAQVAFTAAGLAALGVPDDALATLPRPLLEGIATSHRSRILGDVGASDPVMWRWGGPENPAVHVLLVLYAPTPEEMGREYAERAAAFEGALVEVAAPIEGLLRDGKEHFGFMDGLSQPVIKGWPRRTSSKRPPAPAPPVKWEEVNPGEILLGYPDNYEKSAEGPTVAATRAATDLLPAAPWAPGRRHLGHNGTFLVFRQLAQDVGAFRRFVADASRAGEARGTPLSPEKVGAKLVGRWASGASLTVHPDTDPGEAGTNDFGYHEHDQAGFGCPLGAHVRRANPRDSDPDNAEKALRASKNHRILRRGRPYGLPPADPPTSPGEELDADRGLLFLCLNSDVERQFEFVQHTWLENPFFAGLHGEADALTGARPDDHPGCFTIPDRPVRRHLTGLPRFVTTVGGGYFFLPGITALRYVASMAG